MIDYGRNLVGNIKVKTRSSGGDFVDMGKTESDKNVKNAGQFKEVTKKEFLKAFDLNKYALAPNGKKYYSITETNYPSKKNEIGLSGYPSGFGTSVFLPRGTKFFVSVNNSNKAEISNSKFKDKDGTLFEVSQYPNGAWYYEIFNSNGHIIGDVGPFRYEDDAIVALKKHNSTVRKVGNKSVVTLKSIPKRIDLDKKSDLEKAIKDITDLSKDYEHGIKVNDDDKYMHDKFVSLLKEANDEVKELKKILAKLN